MGRVAFGRFVALVLVGALASCSSVPRDVPDGEPPRKEDRATGGPLDPLSRRFGLVRQRLRERGYSEAEALARRFALEGRGRVQPVDLPAGRCTTFVALSGGGMRDLRLSLYDGEGAEVSQDVVEGEGGLVHVCPQWKAAEHGTIPHYLVFEAKEGSGAIVAARFESNPGRSAGFEGLFDSVLAPRVPMREVEAKLSTSRTALRARGLSPLGEPRLERVAEGETLRLARDLDEGRCYVAVAHAGEGVTDVDFFLYDEGGAEVARDLESNAEPILEHCPREGGRHTFEARAFEGAGALGILIFEGPEGAVHEPPPPGTEEARAQSSSSIASPRDPVATLSQVATQLAVRGYEPVFVVRDGPVTPGEVRTHDVLVGPGCGVALGAATEAGTDLDLYLSDPGGRALDRDTRVGGAARVVACPREASVLRLAVKAYGREGSYALAVFRAPPAIRDVAALRLEEATHVQRARGYAEVERVHLSFEEGQEERRTFKLASGRCAALAVAGDDGIEDVDLFLRGEEGQLLASESGPAPWATVTRCANERESIALDIVAYRGAGDVTLVRLEGEP